MIAADAFPTMQLKQTALMIPSAPQRAKSTILRSGRKINESVQESNAGAKNSQHHKKRMMQKFGEKHGLRY